MDKSLKSSLSFSSFNSRILWRSQFTVFRNTLWQSCYIFVSEDSISTKDCGHNFKLMICYNSNNSLFFALLLLFLIAFVLNVRICRFMMLQEQHNLCFPAHLKCFDNNHSFQLWVWASHEHLTQRQTAPYWQIVTAEFLHWSDSVYHERENNPCTLICPSQRCAQWSAACSRVFQVFGEEHCLPHSDSEYKI